MDSAGRAADSQQVVDYQGSHSSSTSSSPGAHQNATTSSSTQPQAFQVPLELPLCPGISTLPPVVEDLLTYLLPSFRGMKIYFDPRRFPVPSTGKSDHDPFKGDGFTALKQFITQVSAKQGVKLTITSSHGTRGGRRQTAVREKVFACAHSRARGRADKRDLVAHKELRKSSYTNDKSNGHKGTKRINTVQTTSVIAESGERCKCRFRFTIHCDKEGFFLPAGFGCGQHTGHLQEPPKRRKARKTTMQEAWTDDVCGDNINDDFSFSDLNDEMGDDSEEKSNYQRFQPLFQELVNLMDCEPDEEFASTLERMLRAKVLEKRRMVAKKQTTKKRGKTVNWQAWPPHEDKRQC